MTIHIKKTFVAFAMMAFALMAGCSKKSDTSNTACNPSTSYRSMIAPILAVNCNTSGCHDNSTITALDNYQTVHDGALQIRTSILAGRMPKNKTLSPADKNAIICWIDNGALNN